MTLRDDLDLSFTVHLKSSRAQLWEAWTTPEHIPHWFIPKPHKITACDLNLTVGGRFNTTFEVDGNTIENNGVFLELIPQTRLVTTDGYSEGWVPAENPFLTAIVEFADHPDGGTLYTATARHRTKDAAQSHKEMGFFDGWGIVAQQLDEYALTL